MIYHGNMARPRLPNPSTPAERKRKQMQRLRDDGFAHAIVNPSPTTSRKLKAIAEMTGSSFKQSAEMVLRRASGTALDELRDFARRYGPIYDRAQRFRDIERYLEHPGATFRVRDTVYRADDWLPLLRQLETFYEEARKRWRWNRTQANRFLEKASTLHPADNARS